MESNRKKESPPRVHAEMVDRHPGCRAIFFLTYQKLTTNVWGFTAFLCQILAVIELAFGLQFVEAGWSRKISSRMPLDEHYEYALYMYHIQSVRDLATNNRILLLIASLEIQLGKYDHATQTITQISVEKCTPVQLKQLYYMQILLAQKWEILIQKISF